MILPRSGLRAVPALVLALLAGPVLAGLAGTLAPAFGILPVIGRVDPGLAGFAELAAWPGLWPALRLSLVTGLAATAIALAIVTALVACWSGSRSFALFRRALSPLLTVPHAAAAFGLAFLIAPSGWIVRALSPWATGWQRPPDLLILQDPAGLALIAGLVVKEVPFLLLMTLAALGQADAARATLAAQSLGHARAAGWLKAVFPPVYTQIRLAVLVVLAYSMTVVDVALILGPNTPPTLAVQVLRWMNDPDLSRRLLGSAAAVAQLMLVLAALALWWVGERAVAWLGRAWIWSGRGRGAAGWMSALSAAAAGASALAVLGGLAVLALWSVAADWRFPDVLPGGVGGQSWARHLPGAGAAVTASLTIAAVSTALALGMAIAALEAGHRYGLQVTRRALWLLYLPLLVPQVAFLPGVQTLMLLGGLRGSIGAVIAVHVIFVFPYVFLSLSDPWRAWDARLGVVGQSLGAGPGRVLWQLRLPMLLAPVLTAAAVGFAVSIGQYLPTLLVGGGRVASVTTEAVALASGGDRRAIGVWALLQTALALAPFALALGLPRLVWCNRRGMMGHG